MDNPKERRHTPWLDEPLVFSGNYREYECTFNDTALCAYQSGYWRFWYEADHRYALPTVAFFLAVIILFALVHVAGKILPQGTLRSRVATRTRATFRYLSYRTFRIPSIDWNSSPIGILMLAVVGVVFFFSMTLGPKPYYWPNTNEVDFGSSPPIATRSGWMALACMPFVFATAGKANLITFCTGVSHERLQVFHRWISYAFLVLALIHTFPFIVYNIKMHMMVAMWDGSVFYWTGVVALIAQGWLTFASVGVLRAWGYEWFKFSHFVAALVFILFFFFHCDGTLTAWDYFVATGVLFSLSWLYRQIRIYFEHGLNHHAELTLTSNGFVRVSVPTKATWTLGQHYFVRFIILGIHSWTTHPFTACSIPLQEKNDSMNELVFLIRPRGGFTAHLANLVKSHSECKVRVLLDGPYGGIKPTTLQNSHRTLVIAGGSGAGWALPFISTFSTKSLEVESSEIPSLKVIMITREESTTTWFADEVQEVRRSLSPGHNRAVYVEIYHTGAGAATSTVVNDMTGPKATHKDTEKSEIEPSLEPNDSQEAKHVHHLQSRPDLADIVAKEANSLEQRQSLSVFVCGPLSMQNDMSSAVAREQLRVARTGTNDVYLHLEHFSWA